MANRVILDSNRLKISQPGFDVLSNTLTQDQIIFDSTLLTPNIIVGGQLNVPNTGSSFQSIVVPIGKTLRPYFFFYLENVEDFYAAGGQGGVYLNPFSINKVFYLQLGNQSIIVSLNDLYVNTEAARLVNHEVDPDMVPYSQGGQFNQYRLKQKNNFTIYYYNDSNKTAKINYGFFDLAFT